MQENTVFSVLNALNCNEHVEKKGNLSYLSRSVFGILLSAR
jgi:hypothetical protein